MCRFDRNVRRDGWNAIRKVRPNRNGSERDRKKCPFNNVPCVQFSDWLIYMYIQTFKNNGQGRKHEATFLTGQ